VLGSIGEDGYFKLWQEDVTQAPKSGRRFKSIMHPVAAKSKLPWMSLDFKNINAETYLALITRDGNLSIMEPKDHDNLSGDWMDWMENRNFQVCPIPPRAEEAGFRVRFHPDKLPCWTAIVAGLDRKALSMAVVAMGVVKIYRTDKERRLYLAAELTGARSLVRDVAWAAGSVRGYDVLATAGKDGVVRVYELKTPEVKPSEQDKRTTSTQITPTPTTNKETLPQPRITRNAPSGIGAGLAGAARMHDGRSDNSTNPSRVKQTVELVAELTEHRGAVWRVTFSAMGTNSTILIQLIFEIPLTCTGDVLASAGDDGTVRTWKRGVNNTWFEYATIESKTFS